MHCFIPAIPETFVERAVADVILQRNPRRGASETEAITQKCAPAATDLIEPGILMPDCAGDVGAQCEPQVARQLKASRRARPALPRPIVLFFRDSIRVGEIAVLKPAGFGIETPI